jgi:predicted nucleic acid-binding protein
VATYTADAVAVLCYLVDELPERADRVFAKSEAGEAVVQAPGTVLTEVLYSISRDKDVRGIKLGGTPEAARRDLVEDGPLSVAPVGGEDLAEYASVVDEFSIHDAAVVASHRTHNTEAIITTDGVISESTARTIWQ